MLSCVFIPFLYLYLSLARAVLKLYPLPGVIRHRNILGAGFHDISHGSCNLFYGVVATGDILQQDYAIFTIILIFGIAILNGESPTIIGVGCDIEAGPAKERTFLILLLYLYLAFTFLGADERKFHSRGRIHKRKVECLICCCLISLGRLWL